MRFQNLADWLKWQETLHPQLIDLGLERIKQVFQRLHPQPPPFTVITVGGTNGKGTTVALLETILLAAGYRVGAYTSPHLLRYNERIRINAVEADDKALCQAFQRVDEARGDISLTYFEFGTLAALDLFYRAPLDIALLEVGLGGRLDAVNIIDSDLAVITSIGLDHTDWLGDDREAIAREKAGIMRPGKPAICSEAAIPATLYREAERIGSRLYCLGRDFHYSVEGDSWCWIGPAGEEHRLPGPALIGEHQFRNASAVLMALDCLADRFPVPDEAVQHALQTLHLNGRQHIIAGKTTWIFDVAHNGQSAEALAALLHARHHPHDTHAIVGMLKDKDMAGVLQPILPYVSDWHCVDLDVPRGASASQLQDVLHQLSPDASISCHVSVGAAMAQLGRLLKAGEQVVVFGSFYTVAEALQRGV